jgi:hypothetical protein
MLSVLVMSPKPKEIAGSRLEIALSVLDQPRTQYEIAKLQGKKSGAVHGVLRRMVDDRELKASDDPPTRGTLYEVHPEARQAVVEAGEGFQAAGTLTEHQRLISVGGGPGRLQMLRILSSTVLAGAVSWVARTNSLEEQLVAMNPTADAGLVDSLVLALSDAGFEVREGLVTQVMSAGEMRDHVKKAIARAKASV